MAKFTTVLIPADHYFVPTQEAIAAAKLLMEKYFPDRGDEVQSCIWEKPAFVDGLDAFEDLVCPNCDETLNRIELEFNDDGETDWDEPFDEEDTWWDYFEGKLGESDDPIATQISMPCCGQEVIAGNIRFPYNAGFARFKLWLPDPGDSMEVTDQQLAQIETTLGCKLIHIGRVWS